MLRKIGMIAVLSLIVVALTASVALAGHRTGHGQAGGTGNPHFVGEPQITQPAANQVRAVGSIAGVGSSLVTVQLTVFAFQEVECRNPGGKVAPGQTETFPAGTETQEIQPEAGRANFDLTVTATGLQPDDPRLQAACPNQKWTAEPGDVVVTGFLLEFFQAGQELTQLERSGTF